MTTLAHVLNLPTPGVLVNVAGVLLQVVDAAKQSTPLMRVSIMSPSTRRMARTLRVIASADASALRNQRTGRSTPMVTEDRADEVAARTDWRDRRPVIATGLGGLGLAAVILTLFGEVSAASRATVLEGLNDSLFWLAGAMIGACTTIAALMLTTLTLVPHLETRRLSPRFLVNMRQTVVGALGTIALAVLCLLLTVFPAAGTEQFTPSQTEVNVLYVTTLALTTLMVGGFAVVLASLYQTIADVFQHLPEDWIDDILADDGDPQREPPADDTGRNERDRDTAR
jgi:hypothetical protein